jgi:hypothetical protein
MELKYKNEKIIVSNAPFQFIEKLLEKYSDNIDELEFSRYASGGQGVTLSREIMRLPFNKEISKNINKKIFSLSSEEEFAIHSNVYYNKKRYCLPLVDFSFNELNSSSLHTAEYVKKYFDSPLYIYHSGRSYHGYILKLITFKEWHKFLGRLLLCNRPNRLNENIDSRWIGHSLENEYSVLRLTCNSKYYLQVPQLVDIIV